MKLTNPQTDTSIATINSLLRNFENIFETARKFSEKSTENIQKLQKFLMTLLDFDEQMEDDFQLPLYFSRKFEVANSYKPFPTVFKKQDSIEKDRSGFVENDQLNSSEFIEIFKDHNKKMMEFMLSGKSNVSNMKDAITQVFENLAVFGDPKSLQAKNEKLKQKIKNVKEKQHFLEDENRELLTFKRVTEETVRINATSHMSVRSNGSDHKSSIGNLEKQKAIIDQKNLMIASLVDRTQELEVELWDSAKSIRILEEQLRFMQDDFISLFKTVNTKMVEVRGINVEGLIKDHKSRVNSYLSWDSGQHNPRLPETDYTNNEGRFPKERLLVNELITEKDSIDKNDDHKRVYSFSQQMLDEMVARPVKKESEFRPKRASLGLFQTSEHDDKNEFFPFHKRNIENRVEPKEIQWAEKNVKDDIITGLKNDSVFGLHDSEENEEDLMDHLKKKELTESEKKSEEFVNSFVQCASQNSSEKYLGSIKSEQDGQTEIRVVIVKETGMNRIDPADFAKILFSQNLVIEKEKEKA